MREAIVEAGREDDVLFFMRSAWLRSPKYNTLFWYVISVYCLLYVHIWIDGVL